MKMLKTAAQYLSASANKIPLTGLQRCYKPVLELPGYWALAFVLALISCLTLIASWVVLPLNGSLYPTALKWSLGTLSIPFYWVFILTLVLSLIFQKRYILLTFFLAWAHFFCILSIPVNILLRHQGIISSYLEQSKIRLGIVEFTNDYFPLNVNIQPLFEPLIAIDNGWDQLVIAVSMLDTSWFITLIMAICVLLLIINNTVKGIYYSIITGLFMIVLFLLVDYNQLNNFIMANNNVNKISEYNNTGDSRTVINLCEKTLTINSAMAYSESMMSQCLLATLKVYGNSHPLFNYSNLIWKQGRASDNTEFASEPLFLYTYKRLLDNNAYLKSTLKSRLDRELINWMNRLGEEMVLLTVKKAVSENNMGYAAHQLNTYIDDKNILKNYYLAYINYSMENYTRSAVNFKSILAKIQFTPIKADMLCSLGDTYMISGDYIYARKVYISCKELDSSSNYRAVKALSGT
jgi:hypothetical protein